MSLVNAVLMAVFSRVEDLLLRCFVLPNWEVRSWKYCSHGQKHLPSPEGLAPETKHLRIFHRNSHLGMIVGKRTEKVTSSGYRYPPHRSSVKQHIFEQSPICFQEA